MDNYIPMKKCKHGYLYEIDARNFVIGVYNKKIKGFLGIREKWGSRFIEAEDHWDTGEPYGTVKPLCIVEECPLSLDFDLHQASDNKDKLFKWLEERNG